MKRNISLLLFVFLLPLTVKSQSDTIKNLNSSKILWVTNKPVPGFIIQSARDFRERLLEDPYRPAYHFCVPEGNGSPGDPNGAFYYNGRYHLMYLYNREKKGFSWGHVSSTDMLHWRHHPDAIGPGDGDEGCFSGGAFVDMTGKAVLSYWQLWGALGIGLAESTDEPLVLRVFIDKSIVEVFANDRQAISRNIYPKLKGRGVRLFSADGDIEVLSVKAWEIMPSNPY